LAARYSGTYNDEGRARYLQAINGMAFGESAEQGVTRGQQFYHLPLGLALTAPTGWKIQNEAEQLTLISGARDVALVMKTVPPQAGQTHDDLIRKLLKPSQGRSERLVINGLQATRFVGARANAQGQLQPLDVTLVNGPVSGVFMLSAVGKDPAALQRARAELQAAQNSFRPLSAADRAAARPWVLKTVTYPRGGFTELARSSPLTQAEPQLRLMNGLYGGGEPKVGQLVKVVE
jgi:predicted Zn-dependent protease